MIDLDRLADDVRAFAIGELRLLAHSGIVVAIAAAVILGTGYAGS